LVGINEARENLYVLCELNFSKTIVWLTHYYHFSIKKVVFQAHFNFFPFLLSDNQDKRVIIRV